VPGPRRVARRAGLARYVGKERIMKNRFWPGCVGILGILLLTACASHPDRIRVGMSREQVLTTFGVPAAERREAGETVLVYSTAPYGQQAYAARLGADQRVVAVEPVLTSARFARVQVGQWTRSRIQAEFGHPAEVRTMRHGEVWWSYRYKQDDTWPMLMNFMFDAGGIVRTMQHSYDPANDPDDPRSPN